MRKQPLSALELGKHRHELCAPRGLRAAFTEGFELADLMAAKTLEVIYYLLLSHHAVTYGE